MLILTKLILAHLIGDFILQPGSWVKAKNKHQLRAWQLYVHCAIHSLISSLLLISIIDLKIAILVFVFHLFIDSCKILLNKKINERILFFGDQILHLISLVFIYFFITQEMPTYLYKEWHYSEEFWINLTAILFLTSPSSMIINKIISIWPLEQVLKKNSKSKKEDNTYGHSLKHAGKYIGILERLLVFSFVVIGEYQAIGFLIAAKSVFRFGDLRDANDRKLTEYILLGTLISFTIAFAVGQICRILLM